MKIIWSRLSGMIFGIIEKSEKVRWFKTGKFLNKEIHRIRNLSYLLRELSYSRLIIFIVFLIFYHVLVLRKISISWCLNPGIMLISAFFLCKLKSWWWNRVIWIVKTIIQYINNSFFLSWKFPWWFYFVG